MIRNNQVLGRPLISYRNTKANIEALTGVIGGERAHATDTGEDGYYDEVAAAWVWGGGGSGSYDLAADIHAATSKTTPVDADELGIWDSVANALKKLTWANLKATLKTYFDTLYAAILHSHAASDITSGTLDAARLPTPTTTALGGVKRNTGSAGQFVNGIDSSGNLTYDTPAGGGREILTADRVYYIRADGDDSNNGLTNTAGGAWLTAAKANDVIATLDKNGYDVDVYMGAGTWSEEITPRLGIGEGTVRWHGTLTLVETATSATVAAGSGGAAGTVTKTGQFTGDTHKGLLAYFATDNAYRVIYSNTANALTLADLAPSSTTQDVSVYSWGTIVNRFTIPVGVGNFEIYGIHVQGDGTYGLYQGAYSAVTAYYCQFNDQTFLYNSNNPSMYDCYFFETAAITMVAPSLGATGIFLRCFIRIENNTGTGLAANRGAQVLLWGGTVDGAAGANKATYGVRAWGNATVQFSTATDAGNVKIYNCDAGVRVDIGGVMVGTSSAITYSGNTANTSNDGTGILG